MMRSLLRLCAAVALLVGGGCTLYKTYTDEELYATRKWSIGLRKLDAGDYVGAFGEFDELIRWNANTPYTTAYRDRGRARMALGDIDGAISDFRQELSLHSNSDPRYLEGVRADLRSAEDAAARRGR